MIIIYKNYDNNLIRENNFDNIIKEKLWKKAEYID